jgi:hypothetical protein
MDLSLSGLFALAQFTLRRPRDSARELLAMGLPEAGRWIGFLVVVLGSAIGTHLTIALMPAEQRAVLQAMFTSPVQTALMQAAVWLAITALITWGGKMRGGRGTFRDALLLIAWLQFILLCVQALQLLLGLALPPAAELVGLIGLLLLVWLLTNFTAVLHGFTSLWTVFLGLVIGAVVLMFALAFVLALVVGAPVPGG